MCNEKMEVENIGKIRKELVEFSLKLIGIPYEFGAEWTDFQKTPSALDCSEMVQGVYGHFKIKMPDGSQNQFDFTLPVSEPQIGDLAFFGRGGGNCKKVYHVGMILNESQIIEARGFQPNSSFDTGKVILRPIGNWYVYKNFAGFRSHPKFVV